MSAPSSVKTQGRYFRCCPRPPRFKVATCYLKDAPPYLTLPPPWPTAGLPRWTKETSRPNGTPPLGSAFSANAMDAGFSWNWGGCMNRKIGADQESRDIG